MSKPEILRLLWVINVLRLVAYLLNMICLNLPIFIQNLTYARFRLIWHSFMSISRDRNKRLMSYRYRLKPEILSFYTIPPFIFLYSPFQQKQKMNRNVFSWVGSSGRTMQANGRTFTVKRSKPTSAKAFNLSWGNTLLETCI